MLLAVVKTPKPYRLLHYTNRPRAAWLTVEQFLLSTFQNQEHAHNTDKTQKLK